MIERKRAEDAVKKARDELEIQVEERTRELRARETRFKDFAEVASDWFREMGPDLRFTYFSDRTFEVTGFRPEDRIGKERMPVVDQDHEPATRPVGLAGAPSW